MGLAARLSTKLVVFERGCFTTSGLECVVQILNVGNSVSGSSHKDITENLVLIENMSINGDIPNEKLMHDLFNTEEVPFTQFDY